MKLLHTGDLHLGKSLHESSLIEDQKSMLDQLRAALSRDEYAALVIAGDVYDRTIPPTDAVELFSSFLARVRRESPALEICVIPGNHDSSQRLSFASRILREQHIHIICNPEESFIPIITEKDGKRLALFLLPFLAPGTLSPETPRGASKAPNELDFSAKEKAPFLATQADLAREASRRLSLALKRPELAGIPSVLVAHLFALNGRSSESERDFLGTAEEVDPALFSGFSYVALGHLHRQQTVTERIRYSGSPLAYAFDEAGADKAFLSVDIDCAKEGFPVTVTPIPVRPQRKVSRLEGAFEDFYARGRYDSYAADYLEISLTDTALVANPMNLLRPKFPWLLSLRQGGNAGTAADKGEAKPAAEDNAAKADTSHRDPVGDFCRFEELIVGFVDPAKKELFSSLLAECADEA